MNSTYNSDSFKKDLSGGLTAGIVTLPVALAYGSATDLGAISGVLSAIVLGIIATVF
jgi:SulP family sulfate permease